MHHLKNKSVYLNRQAENKTGDFLAVLYRKDVDASLADTLASNWKGDGKQNKKKSLKDNTVDRNPRTFRVNNKEITIMKKEGLLFFSFFPFHDFDFFFFGVSFVDKPIETVKSNNSKYRLKKVRMDLVAEVGEKLELLTSWIDLLRSDHR